MWCGTRRALGVAVVAAVMASLVLAPAACAPSAAVAVTGATNGGRGGEDVEQWRRETASIGVGDGGGDERSSSNHPESSQAHLDISHGKSEAELIQPIPIPFKQQPDEWEVKGISLTVTGEPKSGTTWFARVIVELCLQLCGNPENTWCQMGGLTAEDNPPAPRYDFEMLHAQTGELFLHFSGFMKHMIPGLKVERACSKGISHPNAFGVRHPCRETRETTREALTACLPDLSPACAQHLPPLDPAVRRMAVLFRDARDLVISEHRMRLAVYGQSVRQIGELDRFILQRFERIVAWIHQRWVWHTTALRDVSHVVFYEDLKAQPYHLVDLASFLGLDCTAEEAEDVWQRHTYANPPGDYTTYGLSAETLEWMNVTMARVLPEAVLERYGLTPIYA